MIERHEKMKHFLYLQEQAGIINLYITHLHTSIKSTTITEVKFNLESQTNPFLLAGRGGIHIEE